MKEIFTELYKKVLGFFQAQEKENIKEVACNRLKLVLMQDRTNLTPALLERMRGEMIDVLSRYVEMDKEALELNFEQEGDQMALMLSIPVLRAKDEEEINALLEAEEKGTEELEEDSDESEEEVTEDDESISNEMEDEEEIDEDEDNESSDEIEEEKLEEEESNSAKTSSDKEEEKIESTTSQKSFNFKTTKN